MKTLPCLISAGEYSGDLLAAELVKNLRHHKKATPFSFFGVTGPAMKRAGVETIASMDALSVMGFFDVLSKVVLLRKLVTALINEIQKRQAKLVILVDYPGFHFYLAKKLRPLGVQIVQYAAPKLWAWGEHRALRLKRDFDLVLGFFPFEIDFFAKWQVPYRYVGNPHLGRITQIKALPRAKKEKAQGYSLVGLIPGSRRSEIENIMPHLCEIMVSCLSRNSKMKFFLPIAPSLSKRTILAAIPANHAFLKEHMVFIAGKSLEVMKAMDVCLVTSGTATLECALLQTPMVVLYKMDRISYLIAKRKVKIPYISLVNIIMTQAVVKEFVQVFQTKDVVDEVFSLLAPSDKRHQMILAFDLLAKSLRETAATPAAKEIARLCNQNPGA